MSLGVLHIEDLRNGSASHPDAKILSRSSLATLTLVSKLKASITVRIRDGSQDLPHDQRVDFGRCFSFRALFVGRYLDVPVVKTFPSATFVSSGR